MEYVTVRLPKAKFAALKQLDPGLGTDPEVNPRLVEWTYDGLRRHMLGAQQLGRTTTESRIRYLRYLETHPKHPVALRPPDEEAWLDHVAARREAGTLGHAAITNYRKSFNHFFRYLGIPRWESLDRGWKAPQRTVIVPPDHLVPRYWTDLPMPPGYTRETLQHVAHLGFHTGLRPPSEICALTLDGIEWDARTLVTVTAKKHEKPRIVDDLGRDVFEWLHRYVDIIRPPSDSARVVVTHDGRPVSPDGLRVRLAKAGRAIWSRFRPYSMRHWFVTNHLIEHGDIYRTAAVAGSSVDILMRHYVDHARARARRRGCPSDAQENKETNRVFRNW